MPARDRCTSELESALADFYGVEASVAFVSGHATNVSTISTLMTPDDLIIYDDLSHNSLLVGTKLSGATAFAFRHNDADALEALLKQHRHLSQARIDRGRGPVLHGRRYGRSAEACRPQGEVRRLADDRRSPRLGRPRRDRSGLGRALRHRSDPRRHLDGHAQQGAGKLRRVCRRQAGAYRHTEVPGSRIGLFGWAVASLGRSGQSFTRGPEGRAASGLHVSRRTESCSCRWLALRAWTPPRAKATRWFP